jgi:hypothetical protein
MSKKDLTTALMTRADQISRSTEILVAKTRDWQLIKQNISNRLDDIELTKEQEEKKKRYQYIYNQLASARYSESEVVTQVMKFFGVKSSQAYEDLTCTREIFGTLFNIDKRFELKVELEAARSARRKAEELCDFKAAAMYSKVIKDILKEVEDESENPAELFEGHEIEAVFDPRLLGAPEVDMKKLLQAINEKRKVKINADLFEEISFEETDQKDESES